MNPTIFIVIEGINPEPWEAPGMAVGRGKGGKPYPMAVKSGRLEAYQAAIRESIQAAYPDLPTAPPDMRLKVTFAFWRQLDSYTKDTGRTASRNVADVTNMQKALEDALQGVLYVNDRNNKNVKSLIIEEGPDVEPCIIIAVHEDDDMERDAWKIIASSLSDEPRPTVPGNVYVKGSLTEVV